MHEVDVLMDCPAAGRAPGEAAPYRGSVNGPIILSQRDDTATAARALRSGRHTGELGRGRLGLSPSLADGVRGPSEVADRPVGNVVRRAVDVSCAA